MFGDEASFWLDGSLHRIWARIGQQPHVDTFGMRKTAHVYLLFRQLWRQTVQARARAPGHAGYTPGKCGDHRRRGSARQVSWSPPTEVAGG
jgi:hypothetical protein